MDDYQLAIDILGWIGVALYVTAYFLVSTERVSGRARSYQYLNLVGALGVALNAFYYSAYPSAIVNVIWFAIALATLANVLRPGTDADPAHPEYSEGRTLHRIIFFTGALLAILGGGVAVLVISPRPPQPLQHVHVFAGEWEPFIGEGLDRQGPVAELGREIFRRAGYEPELRFVGWAEAENRIVVNREFAAFPFVASGDRGAEVLFSDALHHFDYVLFFREGGPVSADLLAAGATESLGARGWRVGVPAGYAVWPALGEAIEAGHLERVEFASVRAAFRALAEGRVDLVPESRRVGRRLLLDPTFDVDATRIRAAAPSPDELERGVLAGSRESLHIMVPRTEAGRDLVDDLNRALAAGAPGATRVAPGRGVQVGDPPAAVRRADDGEPATRVELRGVTDAVDDDGVAYLLASGVQAVVLRWPRAFVAAEGDPGGSEAGSEAGEEVAYPALCRIKVVTGPLRGRILHVASESFEVLPPEEDR